MSALSSISYVQQKAMNDDIDGLIEEYVGFSKHMSNLFPFEAANRSTNKPP